MQASSGELQSVDTGVSEAEQPSLHHQTEASASCLHTDQGMFFAQASTPSEVFADWQCCSVCQRGYLSITQAIL